MNSDRVPQPRVVRPGGYGESIAALFLEMSGYRILARNQRCGSLEIDLVAERDGIVALVEVRTRGSRSHGRPEDSLRYVKRRNLARAATRLAVARPGFAHRPLRIDLIAVERTAFGLTLRHLLGIARPSAR